MNTLETLADGRQLHRIHHPLAAALLPGQQLRDRCNCFPVFRHNPEQLTIDIVCVPDADIDHAGLHIVGQAWPQPSPDKPILILSHNDEIFAALHLLAGWSPAQRKRTWLLSAFDQRLPFRPAPSKFLLPDMPPGVIAALPLLEDWGVISRIASLQDASMQDTPGCFNGTLEQLQHYLPTNLHYALLQSPDQE